MKTEQIDLGLHLTIQEGYSEEELEEFVKRVAVNVENYLEEERGSLGWKLPDVLKCQLSRDGVYL